MTPPSATSPPAVPGPAHPGLPATPLPRVAGLGVRAAARLLDAGVLGTALLPLALLVNLLGPSSGPHYDSSSGQLVDGGSSLLHLGSRLVVALVLLGYEPLLIATHGTTIGKRAFRLSVLRRQDGAVPGWAAAVLRWLVPLLAILACFVGEFVVYLSPLLDRTGYNRGWHDKLAGTVVVQD